VDIFPAHKRIGYDEETAVKIMDDDNRNIAIFIITHMLNTCRDIIIQGVDGKNILPSVFRSMGLAGFILLDKVIQHFVPDYSCHQAKYRIEADFPAYLTFNKKTGKTCFIRTCPQIGSSLVRPDITKYEFKFWTRVTHLLVSAFLKITGAKYRQECFPDFTTINESVLSFLNTKKGASDHMELLHKSGQLSNVVSLKHHARLVVKIPMRVILGNQMGAILSRRKIVIPCHLRIEAKQAMRQILEKQRVAILSRRRIVIQFQLWIEAKRAMRLILEKQRVAILSRRKIVIPCHLRIEAEREAKLPSASLRVDLSQLNSKLRHIRN
jgi:hypothetical protein